MKILAVLFAMSFTAFAQNNHWDKYCINSGKIALDQFFPVWGNDDKLVDYSPTYHSLDPDDAEESVTNKGGAYYNSCYWSYRGYGNPNEECVAYCRSVLNLMTAITEAIEKYDKQGAVPLKNVCKAPPRTNPVLPGANYSRQNHPECTDCSNRIYNKSVQRQTENCLVAYNAYAAANGGFSAQGGNPISGSTGGSTGGSTNQR